MGGDAPCPKRRFALCCSDVCVRDEVSGDKLCAPVLEKDASPGGTPAASREEIPARSTVPPARPADAPAAGVDESDAKAHEAKAEDGGKSAKSAAKSAKVLHDGKSAKSFREGKSAKGGEGAAAKGARIQVSLSHVFG